MASFCKCFKGEVDSPKVGELGELCTSGGSHCAKLVLFTHGLVLEVFFPLRSRNPRSYVKKSDMTNHRIEPLRNGDQQAEPVSTGTLKRMFLGFAL